jgi:hypothetical protein
MEENSSRLSITLIPIAESITVATGPRSQLFVLTEPAMEAVGEKLIVTPSSPTSRILMPSSL